MGCQSSVEVKQNPANHNHFLAIEEDTGFNFEVNEVLSVEKIIRATFANPRRRIFPRCKNVANQYHNLYPDNINPEALIKKIATEMPIAFKSFNQKKIKLYDTDRLHLEIDK